MTRFEVRVLCRRLPKSVNDFGDDIISSDISSPILTKNSSKRMKKNVEQQIREYERRCLANILEAYEFQIDENENFYQKEWLRLCESAELFRRQEESDYQMENFMNCLTNYLQHRVETGLRRIRYKETIFRMKLNHPRRRGAYSSQPLLLSSTNRAMNVYPEVIAEISAMDRNHLHRFTNKELDLLLSAGMSPILIVLCERTDLYTYMCMFFVHTDLFPLLT